MGIYWVDFMSGAAEGERRQDETTAGITSSILLPAFTIRRQLHDRKCFAWL